MENKRNEFYKTQEYTKDKLFNDVLITSEEYINNTQKEEKSPRNFMYMVKVLQSIVYIKLPPYDFKAESLEDIKNKIELYLEENELLFGYTFFVSSNTNFDYSWSYLRKQIDKYADFIFEAHRFINYLLRDINIIKLKLKGNKDLHIEFNELFDVTFIEESPFVKTTINWDNFNQINKVKNGYYLSIKIGKTTLTTYNRKYNKELEPLLHRVNEILATRNNNYKG